VRGQSGSPGDDLDWVTLVLEIFRLWHSALLLCFRRADVNVTQPL
jgi:hypothetical protein